jgi:hypothetical protein
MATIVNLYMDQGSEYSSILTLTGANGTPLVLTGYTVHSQMRKSYYSSKFYAFTCTVEDATAGKIKLAMSSTVNDNISGGRWLYDIEIVNTDTGTKKRVVEGIVIVAPQITRVVETP